MDLKSALKEVLKIVPRKKEMEMFQRVHFVEGGGVLQNLVVGTDGVSTYVVRLDEDVHIRDGLYDSNVIRTAVRDGYNLRMASAGSTAMLKTGSTEYILKKCNAKGFPALPVLPEAGEFKEIAVWKDIANVFFAADGKSAYPAVAFRDNYVLTADKAMLARVEANCGLSGVAGIRCFKSWPRGDVAVSADSVFSYFRIGCDLYRITPFVDAGIPEVAADLAFDAASGLDFVELDAGVFYNAVKQAAAFGEHGIISLQTAQGGVVVTGYKTDNSGVLTDQTYSAFVSYPELTDPSTLPCKDHMFFDGEHLTKILKAVHTGVLQIGFGVGEKDPLVVRDNEFVYTALLWRMLVV